MTDRCRKVPKEQSEQTGLSLWKRSAWQTVPERTPAAVRWAAAAAIARALAADPEIIYFHEPTSARLELTGEVLAAMQQLAQEGRTIWW